ncbi:hypothetical protein AVEN_125284-1, partial [Araneus ventricosus]
MFWEGHVISPLFKRRTIPAEVPAGTTQDER